MSENFNLTVFQLFTPFISNIYKPQQIRDYAVIYEMMYISMVSEL